MRIKLLISSVLAFLPFISLAERITDAQAMSIAESVLGKQVVRTMPTKVLHARGVNGATEITQPFYDIFNGEDGNGFVIVSTDRHAPQVIGYGEGLCDPTNLPPQLSAILEGVDSLLNANNSLPEHPSWQQRAPRLLAEGDGGKLLQTAQWAQGYPYNEQTPVKNEMHCLTGCVATAMSIVMKYNQWPNDYTWSDMPLEVASNTSYPELARLMADAGNSVYMNYGLDGSGADPNWAGHKLQSDFHYSPECQYITRNNFDKSVWYNMLHGEIEDDRVVIYAGGEHAFIIDGYDSTGNYHINWGWGPGGDNGYFDIEYLETQKVSYFTNSGMVINIEPDRSSKEYSKCFVDYGYFWMDRGKISGCSAICGPSDTGQGKSCSFTCYILNIVPEFDGKVGLALMDKDDNVKQILHSEDASNLDSQGLPYVFPLTGIGLEVTQEMASTDRLQIVSQAKGSDKWLEMLGTIEAPSYLMVEDIDDSACEVNVKMTSTDLVCLYYLSDKWYRYKMGVIDEDEKLPKGMTLYFDLNNSSITKGTIKITAKNENGDVAVQSPMENIYYTTIYGDHFDVLIEVVQPGQEDPADQNVKADIDGVKYQINEDYAAVIGFDPSCSTEPFIPVEITYSGSKYPVTEIADKAFENTALERAYIYAKLTRIGERAFSNCASLNRIFVYNETPSELHSTAFNGVNTSSVYVNVPLNSYLLYKEADNWKALNLVPMGGTLDLNDEVEYLIDKDVYGCTLSYTRTVTNDNWMGVYLPFEIDVTTMAGTYATLTNVSSDGVLEWTTKESGKISACTPFIFKPAAAGDIIFKESPVMLNSCNKANPVSIDGYKLEGNFQTKTDMADCHAYALSKGNFYYTTHNEKTLKPYRIFLTVPNQVQQMKAPVRCRVNGQDVTAIEDIEMDGQSINGKTYNLQGISVGLDHKGVVIVNGKKVIRK